MSSGVNAFEIDLNWECQNCYAENEATCWAEGDYANGVCAHCDYEQEIAI
jgi:hypothetical protein